MNAIKDEQSDKGIGFEARYAEVVDKTVEIVSWIPVYSDKYKGQRVHLFCITPKAEDLIVTTFSYYVLRWCITHTHLLPLKVKLTVKDNAQVLKIVEGGE